MWRCIEQEISESLEQEFIILHKEEISGGDISRSYLITDNRRKFFVKVNRKSFLSNFEAESSSLSTLAHQDIIRVPGVICCGITLNNSFLVLEYLSLHTGTDEQWYDAGINLARLHQTTSQGMFGWDSENFIGETVQVNEWRKNWSVFFAEQRIGWQLQLLAEKDIYLGDIQRIQDCCHDLLEHHKPNPSLLHGDLWHGNIAFADDEAVIYDPACYYGDREADIAMTELFGRLPEPFYQGYQQQYPLSPRYEERKELYNFYHILNHCNLFGGIYIPRAKKFIENYLML